MWLVDQDLENSDVINLWMDPYEAFFPDKLVKLLLVHQSRRLLNISISLLGFHLDTFDYSTKSLY